MSKIGDDRSISVLVAILQADDSTEWKERHVAAMKTLGKTGSVPVYTIPLIMDFASNASEEVDYFERLEAIETLGKVRPPLRRQPSRC